MTRWFVCLQTGEGIKGQPFILCLQGRKKNRGCLGNKEGSSQPTAQVGVWGVGVGRGAGLNTRRPDPGRSETCYYLGVVPYPVTG